MYYRFKRTIKKIIRALLCLWTFILCFTIVPRVTYADSYVARYAFQLYSNTGLTTVLPESQGFQYITLNKTGSTATDTNFYFSPWLNGNNRNSYITIPFMVGGSPNDVYFNNANYCQSYTKSGDYYTCNGGVATDGYATDSINVDFNLAIYDTDGGRFDCSTDWNLHQFVCPVTYQKRYNRFRLIYTAYLGNNSYTHRLLISRGYVSWASDSNTLHNDLGGINSSIGQTNSAIKDTQDIIKNDNVLESQNSGSSFFSGFSENSHGLTGIISAPLIFLNNITTDSCSPLHLQFPFINKSVDLPCMKPIYQSYFGGFFTLYQTITTGIIAYAVLIRIFATIKGLQDPQNDKIEVINL